MRQKQYSFAVMVLSCLAALIPQRVQAVSLRFAPEGNINFTPATYFYELGGQKYFGTVYVTPTLSLQRGGTQGLRKVIRQSFPDWTINIAPRKPSSFFSLNGEFLITNYEPCTPFGDCGRAPNIGLVGGTLTVQYIPGAGDPVPGRESALLPALRVGWVQRVKSNHPIVGFHNGIEDVLDIESSQSNPFYSVSSLDGYIVEFYDKSTRLDPQRNHWWQGELYLATQLEGTKTLTIYDGFRWGWVNTVKRVQTLCEPTPSCSSGGGGSNGGGDDGNGNDGPCEGYRCYALARSQVVDEGYSVIESPTSVPEPNSVLALIAAGVLGGATQVKQREASTQKRRTSPKQLPNLPVCLLEKYTKTTNKQSASENETAQKSTSVTVPDALTDAIAKLALRRDVDVETPMTAIKPL